HSVTYTHKHMHFTQPHRSMGRRQDGGQLCPRRSHCPKFRCHPSYPTRSNCRTVHPLSTPERPTHTHTHTHTHTYTHTHAHTHTQTHTHTHLGTYRATHI